MTTDVVSLWRHIVSQLSQQFRDERLIPPQTWEGGKRFITAGSRLWKSKSNTAATYCTVGNVEKEEH